MKHFLHILVLTLILAFPLRVCADTVTFDFTTDGGLNALGIEKPKTREGYKPIRQRLFTPRCNLNTKAKQCLNAYTNMEL